jgi:hypothetical protein
VEEICLAQHYLLIIILIEIFDITNNTQTLNAEKRVSCKELYYNDTR